MVFYAVINAIKINPSYFGEGVYFLVITFLCGLGECPKGFTHAVKVLCPGETLRHPFLNYVLLVNVLKCL